MTVYRVEGMTCGGCAGGLNSSLLKINLQAKVKIDHEAGLITVTGLTAEEVETGVENAGFDFCGVASEG